MLGDPIEEYAGSLMSGAPPPEGIPAIEDPRFDDRVGGLNVAITYCPLTGTAVTWVAFRQPKACSFNRSAGVLASLPALLAGGACCAPALILILGLQLSSLMVSVFQVLISLSVLTLLVSLKFILDRTDPRLLAA